MGAILVPIDGSTVSEAALGIAIPLARRMNARLDTATVHPHPLHPLHAGGAPVRDSQFDRDLRAGDVAYVAHLATSLESLAPDLTTSTRLLDGAVVDELAKLANAREYDLVVMTTHGRTGASRLWLGSVADRLLRLSKVPVLLLTEQSSESARTDYAVFDCVVIPLDPSDENEEIIDAAIAIAGTASTYHLLHVVVPMRWMPMRPALDIVSMTTGDGTPPADILGVANDAATASLARVADRLRGRGLRVTTRVQMHESPAEAILAYAEEHKASLIAMATHGGSVTTRLLLGSVTDKVVRGATVPVLVRRPSATK